MTENKSDNDIIQDVIRLVDEGMKVTMKVRGRSMMPFIVGDRDSLVLEKPGHVREGDIVLAWCEPGHYVVHRIVRIDGDRVTLMGDGNLAATEACRMGDIKAKATHVIKGDSGRQHSLYSLPRRWAATMWRWAKPIRRYLLYVFRRCIKTNAT